MTRIRQTCISGNDVLRVVTSVSKRASCTKTLWMPDQVRHDKCTASLKSKRTAFALLEMLAVIAALVVLMSLTVKPMRTLLADMPRSHRDFQVWTQTTDMLDQLRLDVEQSGRMLVFEMDPRISHDLLYLESADGLVSYSLTDGKVTRQSNIPGQVSSDVWELPHVEMNWQFWQKDNGPYALEITTWSQRTVFDKPKQKFKQSHVYFQKQGAEIHEK